MAKETELFFLQSLRLTCTEEQGKYFVDNFLTERM
jgi:hypothetical protein